MNIRFTVRRSRSLFGIVLFVCGAFGQGSFAGLTDNGELHINLMLSGGGTRAAAFAYGAMMELDRFCRRSGHWQYSDVVNDSASGHTRHCGDDKSLLESLDTISAVSGGSITAGYYQTHSRHDFLTEFPSLLRENSIQSRLLFAERPWSWGRIIRPPLLLITSAIDTVINFLSIPLFFVPVHMELTPPATMVLTDGILEPAQLAKVYDDVFFDGKTLGSIVVPEQFPVMELVRRDQSEVHKFPRLLINTTDIANGRTFSFDEDTFKCVGAPDAYQEIPVALAAAASSSIPGIFAPVELDAALKELAHGSVDYNKCPLILSNRVRPPILVDGGIGDNLGVSGVLRHVFEEKRLHPERRSAKELLIIVNAGTEVVSSLPSLAGHLDNSFDALIRDKTDLSRVLATGLLNHFGFQTIELKLSDAVTTPLIKDITDAYRNQITKLTPHQNTEVGVSVQQGYATTEMQRKVLSDLEQAGILPAPDQIDTLIAAGRAIVTARRRDIERELWQAEAKTYSPICEKISNPSKYFCWPESFQQAHLAGNRIGPLLHVLTDTGSDFIRKTESNRGEIVSALKEEFLRSLRKEVLVMPGQEQNRSRSVLQVRGERRYVRELLSQSLWSLGMDALFSRTLQGDVYRDKGANENVAKAWLDAISCMQNTGAADNDPSDKLWKETISTLRALKLYDAIPRSEEVMPRCTREKRFKNEDKENQNVPLAVKRLKDLLEEDEREKVLSNSAQYYIVRARLANRLGLIHEAKTIYNDGIKKYPRHEDLLTFFGWHLVVTHRDHRVAVAYLRQALWLVQDHRNSLSQQKQFNEPRKTSVEDLMKLDEHLAVQENRIKLALSFALATALVDIEDHPRYVSEELIHQWELTHLPSKEGASLLDTLLDEDGIKRLGEKDRIRCALEVARADNQDKKQDAASTPTNTFTFEKWKEIFEQSVRAEKSTTALGSECAWLNQIALEHPSIKMRLSELVFDMNKYLLLCRSLDGGECNDLDSTKAHEQADQQIREGLKSTHGRLEQTLGRLKRDVNELRFGIRSELASDLGLERASEYARDVYEHYFNIQSSKDEQRDSFKDYQKDRPIAERLFFWLKPESAAMRGFVTLAKNAALYCPARKPGIRAAADFFQEAQRSMKEVRSDAEKWIMRYKFFEATLKDLECP
jgi:predicted acylesterase/phospholipase RssA